MNRNNNKVSAIIAAKNEAKRIHKVLDIICKSPLVDEVIVVAGGSTDDTCKIARSYGVCVDDDDSLKGKTLNVRKGLSLAKNDIIFLIDADLEGLDNDAIERLVMPVKSGQVDMTLSIRKNSALIYKWFGIDFVSGERVLRKELLKDPSIWSKSNIGYSLEVLMNKSLLSKRKSFIAVNLPKLIAIRKSAKSKHYLTGALSDAAMVFKIFKALPFYEVIGQFFIMSKLNKKYQKLLKLNS